MKVLLVGSGGRESALAWKLAQSPKITELYAAPGNPGMEKIATIVPINVAEIDELVSFAGRQKMDLVVVGPEGPLAEGLADRICGAGIPCFGPRAEGALLESSKKYAKDFMARHGIPTAEYRTFSSAAEASRFIESRAEGPVVVKADGLAQGKGVVVAADRREALDAVSEMMDGGKFGSAGHQIVVEECLEGEELSLLAFVDGKRIVPMPPVQDHKRIGEGDTGPNTGGMGTYSPVAIYTPEAAKRIEKEIVRPTEKALASEGLEYRGCLYFGLMLTREGPKVIEFNVRFGDPETQVLMPLLKSDLLDILYGCAVGDMPDRPEWHEAAAVCVILASSGYPGGYTTGYPIEEGSVPADIADKSWIFHAGTARNEKGDLVTAGGRVLAVTAMDETIEEALQTVYRRVEGIRFEGCTFRRDIARREAARRGKTS